MLEFLNAFLRHFWQTSLVLAPALALGLLIAGLLHVFVKKEKILSHLGKPGFVSCLKATLAGIPIPLCSCGVIPAALGLRRDGASRGAATSFFISTPQTGVDSISVTWALLGFPITLAKVITALIAGVVGGTMVDATDRSGLPENIAPECILTEQGSRLSRIWRYSFNTIFRDIYGSLLFGITVSALIMLFIKPGQLADVDLLQGPLGLFAALAIGIPMYVCSVASVPIAAGLIHAGFPVGSALVFLVAGPATNVATISVIRKSFGNRVFIIYLLTVVVTSLGAGLILNNLQVSLPEILDHSGENGHSFSILEYIFGPLILLGIAYFLFTDIRRRLIRKMAARKQDEAVILDVTGMSCGNCENKITSTLNRLTGIKSSMASAQDGKVSIYPKDNEEFILENAIGAIEELGYKVNR